MHCQLWVTRYRDPHSGLTVSKSWYCPGIGLVRHEHTADAITDVRVLKSCHIAGGSGLLPLEKGNRWEYADPYHPEVMRSELVFFVEYADGTDTLMMLISDLTAQKK